MPPDDSVKIYFFDKLKEIGIVVVTIVADNFLLGLWLAGEYALEHWLVPHLPVESLIARICFWAFRVVFALSTIGPSALYTFRDLRVMWLRAKARIRETEDELKR